MYRDKDLIRVATKIIPLKCDNFWWGFEIKWKIQLKIQQNIKAVNLNDCWMKCYLKSIVNYQSTQFNVLFMFYISLCCFVLFIFVGCCGGFCIYSKVTSN